MAKVAKILVMGSNADKTAIIRRYVDKTFDDAQSQGNAAKLHVIDSTVTSKHVRVKGEILKLQFWDIATDQDFVAGFYQYACAAIIAFDMTNKDELKSTLKWKADLDKRVRLKNAEKLPVILCANRYDKVEDNEALKAFTDAEMDEFCECNNFAAWFATSAKSGYHIKTAINFLICKIVRNNEKMQRPSSSKCALNTADRHHQSLQTICIQQEPEKKRRYTFDGLFSYFNHKYKGVETDDHRDIELQHDIFAMHHA